MDSDFYIRKVRMYLNDPKGKIFSESEIREMLGKAAEQYSADSEIYRSGFYLCSDRSGRCRLPSDYIRLLAGWGIGYQLEFASPDELVRYYSDYHKVKGKPDFIYEDLDSAGKIRLCPNPHEQQGVKSFIISRFGTAAIPKYGILRGGKTYGVPTGFRYFKAIGDCVYIRKESFERIDDRMALVYHVLYQAYRSDNDFADAGKSEYYRKLYKMRADRAGQPTEAKHRERIPFF